MAEDGSDELIFICKYEKGRWFNSQDVTCLLTMFEIKDLNRLSFYFKKCYLKEAHRAYGGAERRLLILSIHILLVLLANT